MLDVYKTAWYLNVVKTSNSHVRVHINMHTKMKSRQHAVEPVNKFRDKYPVPSAPTYRSGVPFPYRKSKWEVNSGYSLDLSLLGNDWQGNQRTDALRECTGNVADFLTFLRPNFPFYGTHFCRLIIPTLKGTKLKKSMRNDICLLVSHVINLSIGTKTTEQKIMFCC